MLTIAVCDDNVQFARLLTNKIRKLCAIMIPEKILCNVVVEFSTAADVIQYVENNTIDILFLDIDMPKYSGFALASELNKSHPDITIIFVSAYDNFVYESFDYNPFRFLRKSHLESELPSTFSKVIHKCIYSRNTLDFMTTDGEVTLRISEILYIESQKNYFIIYCGDGTHKCRGTITQAEEAVGKFDFFRIHAAYIINFDNIEKLNNDNTLLMKNGDLLKVSQRRYVEFKNEYTKFIRRRFLK